MQIKIRWNAWLKLQAYAQRNGPAQGNKTVYECGGPMLIENPESGVFVVEEVYLYGGETPMEAQDGEAATWEASGNAVGATHERLLKEGVDLKKLRGEWHSHADMGCGQSTTDVDNIKQRYGPRGGYAIALTVNAKGGRYADFWVFEPFKQRFTDVSVVVESPELVLPDVDEELKKRVKIKTWSTWGTSGFNPNYGYVREDYWEGYMEDSAHSRWKKNSRGVWVTSFDEKDEEEKYTEELRKLANADALEEIKDLNDSEVREALAKSYVGWKVWLNEKDRPWFVSSIGELWRDGGNLAQYAPKKHCVLRKKALEHCLTKEYMDFMLIEDEEESEKVERRETQVDDPEQLELEDNNNE